MSFLICNFACMQRYARRCRRMKRISRLASCRMLHVLLVLISAGALQLSVFAGDNPENYASGLASVVPKSKLPPATEILAQARAGLPRQALRVKGQIMSGGRLGKLERSGHIEMYLDFGADPAIVRYKISDAFGDPLEQMTISMSEDCEVEFEYESGNPLKPAPAPPPTGSILHTDVTWGDLSLLFLWRPDGQTAREESLRGRDCYVIEFPDNAGVNSKTIWIDMQMLMLIQMEDTDRAGKLQRRLTVKNIKQISDQWMIKNLEIRSYPSFHHTLIRIDDVVAGP